MNIEAITAANGVDASTKSYKTLGEGFETWLSKSIDNVNEGLIASDNKVQQYAIGETDSIHDVMLSIEKAKLNFQLMVEVRNRMLEGYQELMRMQV